MSIEVENLLLPNGGIVHDIELKIGDRGSYWFRTAIHPGFSDAHAHPHVIDIGIHSDSRIWSNSLEWMKNRVLKVDEKALRKDLELCTQLSELTILRALLNGTTMIALVGNLEANFRAYKRLSLRPRTVIMPTILNSEGWYNSKQILPLIMSIFDQLENRHIKIGIFCHSLYFTSRDDILLSMNISGLLDLPLALHLSEGTRDLDRLRSIINGKSNNGIIGIHCIEDEDYKSMNIRIVSCPISNLVLYGRTQNNLDLIDAFGTDWPLIIGSLREHIPQIMRIFREEKYEILKKCTLGGYKLYNYNYSGDYVFFDERIERVLSNPPKPVYVSIGGKFTVVEGTVMGYTLHEVDKMIESIKRYAIDCYSSE